MTLEEQEIIDNIWGEEADAIDSNVLEGIFAMAEIAANRVEQGMFFVVSGSDSIH